jgi:hypothetical protein
MGRHLRGEIEMRTDRWSRWMRSRMTVGLLSLCLLIGLSSCWNAPDAQTSALYGAGMGGFIGGVFGCSLGYSFSSKNNQGEGFAIGCPVGVAAGAAIGGVLGYAMYGPPPEQWKPPKKPTPPPAATSSTTSSSGQGEASAAGSQLRLQTHDDLRFLE